MFKRSISETALERMSGLFGLFSILQPKEGKKRIRPTTFMSILIGQPCSTPDYITPDGQYISNSLDCNKENIACPKSPEKIKTVKSKRQRQAITEDTLDHPKANMFLARARSIVRCLNDDGLIHLSSQLGICQVAAKCFPHLQHIQFDPTGIPVWSFYNLHAPLTFIGLRDTVVKYNDFIRVEGCLYGCTAKRVMGGHSASTPPE